MKSELEFSKNDSYVLVISFIKLATFTQGVPISGETIQHYCTTLKYLFRATAVLQMKSIEKDHQFKNLSVNERVALQMEVLPLIPRDAVVSVTYPFGRLNAFAADVVKMSGSIKRPIIEDCTVYDGVPGAAIISQQHISLPLLTNCIFMLLKDALHLLDTLLLGFKYKNVLTELFENDKIPLSDAVTSSYIPNFCVADWVALKLGHEYKLDPYHCDLEKIQYYLVKEEPTRMARINTYMESCDTLTEILITLVHLSSGPCARATELATTLYRNGTERERSLLFSNGSLCLVYTYNKTNSLTGSIRTIVRPIATPVAKVILLYSTLVRPFKERILGIERLSCGWISMWTIGNEQISPDKVRTAIQFYSSKYGFPLSIKFSRQYISWICVKYLQYVELKNENEIDIYSGFGHGKTTSLRHYAHTLNDSATIDRDSWNDMIHTAIMFQKLLFGTDFNDKKRKALSAADAKENQYIVTKNHANNIKSLSKCRNFMKTVDYLRANPLDDMKMGIFLKKGLQKYMNNGVTGNYYHILP